MDGFSKCIGLALVTSLSLIAIACSTPTIPDDNSGDDNGSDMSNAATTKKTPKKAGDPAADPTGGDASAPTDPTDPTDPTTPTTPTTVTPSANCSSSTSADACFDCCNAPTNGALAAADNAYGTCACGDTGQCTSACNASLCNGDAPTAACQSCLTATCEPLGDAACTSAACKAGQACLVASACDMKQ